ncbi:MAG: hypothetical protein AAFO06_04555 [Cyanobacteria bacterium J06597_16]
MNRLPPETEQDAALTKLWGLPPNEWREDCNTTGRLKHWQLTKEHCIQLHAEMKAFFGGQESTIEHLPEDLKEFVRLRRKDYMALYSLLFQGWREIKKAIDRDQLDIFEPPQTPGEMLIKIIELEAAGFFLQAFPELITGNAHSDFSPRKTYLMRSEGRNIQKALALGKLTSKQRKILDKHKEHLGRSLKDNWGSSMRVYCVMACVKAVKGKRDPINRELIDYKRANSDLWEYLYSGAHPSKPAKGWSWVNGELMEGHARNERT